MNPEVEFGNNELEERFPEAYAALPEPYKNDSCLVFFVDINGHLCAEHDMGHQFIWMQSNEKNEWVEVDAIRD